MNSSKLKDIIACGETSKVQFKETLPNNESMSRELVAMSNSGGGQIFIGVKDKDHTITGLSPEQIAHADRKVAECADNLKPPIYITTEVVKMKIDTVSKLVLVISIPDGINKPYKTARGEIYIKQALNKRLLTDNAEIMRLYAKSNKLLVDELEIADTSIDDVNKIAFAEYFKQEYGKTYEKKGLTFKKALIAKRVLKNNRLTLAGLLFFGNEPQLYRPAYTIKFVSFFGNDMAGSQYRSKPEDIKGRIPQLYDTAIRYLEASLFHKQNGRGFNSIGELEISKIALEELVQNALLHRDYFRNAPIRIMVFDDRVEIISPGALPNSLTVEDIKYGNLAIRNNQLLAFGSRLLPFSGLGTGIQRALEHQPNIEFENDVEGEMFKVVIPRAGIRN